MGSEHDAAVDMRLDKIEKECDSFMKILHGESGVHMGLVTRVQIVWHSYVWLVGLLGAGIGSAVTLLVNRFLA